MIFDVMVLFAGFMTQIIVKVFTLFTFVMPADFQNSISYFISNLAYFGHIFPIDTLMEALGTLLAFYSYMFLVKIFLFVLSLIPVMNNVSRGVPKEKVQNLNRNKY